MKFNQKLNNALNVLDLEVDCNLIQLKMAYRAAVHKWHPDKHIGESPEKIQQATEMFLLIDQAYDFLEPILRERNKLSKGELESWQKSRLPKWEKQFRALWRSAYQHTVSGQQYAAMELNTCILTFTRAAIAPPNSWFLHCLFEDTPEKRTMYREQLLRIAPNKTMKEVWARKYFNLEFGGGWIFYLPGAPAPLNEAA